MILRTTSATTIAASASCTTRRSVRRGGAVSGVSCTPPESAIVAVPPRQRRIDQAPKLAHLRALSGNHLADEPAHQEHASRDDADLDEVEQRAEADAPEDTDRER